MDKQNPVYIVTLIETGTPYPDGICRDCLEVGDRVNGHVLFRIGSETHEMMRAEYAIEDFCERCGAMFTILEDETFERAEVIERLYDEAEEITGIVQQR